MALLSKFLPRGLKRQRNLNTDSEDRFFGRFPIVGYVFFICKHGERPTSHTGIRKKNKCAERFEYRKRETPNPALLLSIVNDVKKDGNRDMATLIILAPREICDDCSPK